jgi:hypothetical protein
MDTITAPAPAPAGPVKDFSQARERLVFRIDTDMFEAAAALPGKTLARFAGRFADIDKVPPEQQLNAITDALGMVLLPDSAALFAKRLEDLTNPISLEQASDVITWLLERYGMRPTEPSSPSSAGQPSPVSGTSLTGAALPPESTPALSLPTGS